MSARVRVSETSFVVKPPFDGDEFAFLDVTPEERFNPPFRRPLWRRMLRGALLMAVPIGAGWAFAYDPGQWQAAVEPHISALRSHVSRLLQGDAAPAETPREVAAGAAAAPQTPVAELQVRQETALPASSAEAVPEPSLLNAAPDATSPTDGTQAGASAPEQTAPAAATGVQPYRLPAAGHPSTEKDPLARRAVAAGLHPGLSRALLARLSAADFVTARKAVDTAMTDAADDGVLVLPAQVKPGLARFRVHFVPGAADGCRRYVVTVAKDGWLTTALPVERCDGKPVAAGKPAKRSP